MKTRWMPYIKPTRFKHESGWRIFEIGYMIGGNKAEKVVPIARRSDHIILSPLFRLDGGDYHEQLALNIDLTLDGYIRIFSHLPKGVRWPEMNMSDTSLIPGEPPSEELDEMWKKIQEEK